MLTLAEHTNSSRGIFCWVYLLFSLFIILLLAVDSVLSEYRWSRYVWLIIMLVLTCCNLCLSGYLHCLAGSELRRKLKQICRMIRDIRITNPSKFSTADLSQPQSECIYLQWTYRDGRLMNLPWNVLVKGDVILLRPGKEAPCLCVVTLKNGHKQTLRAGEMCSSEVERESTSGGVLPVKAVVGVLEETPAVHYVRTCVNSGPRPDSLLERELHNVVHVILERRVLPVAILVTIIALVAKRIVAYFNDDLSDLGWSGDMVEQLCCVLVPLVNPMLPGFLYLVHTVCLACILCQFKNVEPKPTEETAEDLQRESECKQDPEQFSYCSAFSDEDGTSTSSSLLHNAKPELKPFEWYRDMMLCVWKQMQGDPTYLSHSANILHALGSVSSVSVVDKKGILSWPNPTPEKIFFFRKGDPTDHLKKHSRSSQLTASQSKQEVLDLTHDPDRAFHVHFDESTWVRHLPNLKPLALNMQYNSCHLDSQYLQLMDHVQVVSQSIPHTLGVINRRCVCHLARSIGLRLPRKRLQEAQCLGAYKRQVDVSTQVGMLRHRTPLPNAFSVVVPDHTAVGQPRSTVMVQGTADLVIDMCSYAWLGDQMVPLSRAHRKKAEDFYHRNSVTAYCAAYALKSLSGVNKISPKMEQVIIDWPRCKKPMVNSRNHARRTRTKSEHVRESPTGQMPPLVEQIGSISCDSGIETQLREGHVVENVKDCMETVLSEQVFLGMIALQYQAKPDVVRLIEQLDKACIRFVYFSKENELRSRVFAEKMGLEAGWNCHISLAADGSKTNLSESGARRISFGNDQRTHSRARKLSLPSDLRVNEERVARRTSRLGSLSPPPVLEALKNKPLSRVPSNDDHIPSLSSSSSSSSSDSSVFADLGAARAECVELLGDEKPVYPIRKYTADMLSALSADSIDCASTVSATESACAQGANAHYWMLNRSQLPKGIAEVRPHLEQVDNVPLLVSLFTDCDHVTTRQMVEIMQDYGETVLVIGSTFNYQNADIFSQSDCSISLEPLSPTSCVNKSVERTGGRGTAGHLAAMITSLPCSLTFHAGHHINLLTLLEMSRHFLGVTRCSLLLTMSLCAFLVVCECLCLLLLLPSPFGLSQILFWLVTVIPCLSASLCFATRDSSRTLRMATPKRTELVAQKVVKRYVLGLLVKYLPSVFIVIIVMTTAFLGSCGADSPVTSACGWWSASANWTNVSMDVGDVDEKVTPEGGLMLTVRCLTGMLVTLYMCIMSSGYVAYRDNCRSHPPFRNKVWCLSCVCVIVLEVLFILTSSDWGRQIYMERISHVSLVVGFMWCVPLVVISEAWKLRETSLYRRDQRRRRLSFGTKLGMNSPW